MKRKIDDEEAKSDGDEPYGKIVHAKSEPDGESSDAPSDP